jgi:transposase
VKNTIPRQVREAIVRSHQQNGLTYAETAALLGVGEATVSRILRRKRETGDVDPRPAGGGNWSPIVGRIARLLRSLVRDMPDATVRELTAALMSRGDVSTSRSVVQRALAREGFTRKKSPSSPKSATRRKTVGGDAPSERS